MAQSFLGSNPGTQITDALEPELLDETAINNETITGTAVEVNFPGKVIAVAEVGAMAATAELDIEVQGADNSAFDENVVSFGHFDAIGDADDNEVRVLAIAGWKRYMRAIAINGVAADAAVRVVLRPADWSQSNTRTA